MRRVQGSHSGENIAVVVSNILEEFAISQKIGFFVTDNATNNDTAVAAICSTLRLKGSPCRRRLRCLGHIVNLAAKSFLFDDEAALQRAFNFDIEKVKGLKIEVKHALEVLAFWRRRGSVGKLHNLIIWIRRTSQRREAFIRLAQSEPESVNGELHLLENQMTANLIL